MSKPNPSKSNVKGQKNVKKEASKLIKDDGNFTLRIINTISYKQTKLTVSKEYTLNDIHKAYAPFEAHPDYYLWKDMFGRTLDATKNLIENGIVDRDELVEFDGIGKEPCILLVFKDGFEDEAPISLNPLLRRRGDKLEKLCRNY